MGCGWCVGIQKFGEARRQASQLQSGLVAARDSKVSGGAKSRQPHAEMTKSLFTVQDHFLAFVQDAFMTSYGAPIDFL